MPDDGDEEMGGSGPPGESAGSGRADDNTNAAASSTAAAAAETKGGKCFSGRQCPKTGRDMCAVADCTKMSDGRRNDHMCRRHYNEKKQAEAETKTLASLEQKQSLSQSADAGEYPAPTEIEDEDAASLESKSKEKKPSPETAAENNGGADGGDHNKNKDNEDDAAAASGGRRTSRRNRKPTAKVAAAMGRIEPEKPQWAHKRKMGGAGGSSPRGGGGGGKKKGGAREGGDGPTRIDYRFLQYGSDDERLRKKPKVYAPKPPPPPPPPPPLKPLGPEPSYLFRKGPLPPPSPPIEPRSGPPDFSLPIVGDQQQQKRPVREHPYATHGIPPEVAGVYAPLIRLRVKRDADASAVLPLPPRTVGGLRDQIEKAKQCNCKKSNCLKLYCECFGSAIHCSNLCNCRKCQNNDKTKENIRERSRIIVSMLERNPNAFRPRPLAMVGAAATAAAGAGTSDANKKMTTPLSTKGCNCRKSFCLKKYCECFQAAVYCNPSSCKCKDCQNFPGNEQREELMQKRQRQAETAAQAAASQYSHRRIGGMMAMGRAGGMTGVGVGGMGEGTEADEFGEAVITGAAGVAGGMVEGDGVAAAALAAGAAAAGVDVFLPPSSYAIPMKLGNRVEVPGLSFGTAGTKISKDESGSKTKDTAARSKKTTRKKYLGNGKRVETEHERAARIATEGLAAKLDKMQALVEKEKQDKQTKKFGSAAEAVKAVGATVKTWDDVVAASSQQFKQQQEMNKIPAIISTQKTASNSYESHAQAKAKERDAMETIRFVKGGLHRIKMATDRAEDRATEFLNDEEKKEEAASSKKDGDVVMADTTNANDATTTESTDPELNALLCNETMPRSEPAQVEATSMSDAERELLLLAAQDAALMHELAKIIREKALEMGAKRIKKAAEAAEKARSVAEAIGESKQLVEE